MSLVFYYAPMSTAVTTHWALEELGIPYEKVRIDLKAGDSHRPSFLALNPNGMVPVVVHDGTPIFESVAIMIHLGEAFGVEKKLFPAPGLQRAEALKWLVWTNVTFGEALVRHQNNTSCRAPEEHHNAKAGAAAKQDVEKCLGILNEELAKKTFLVGEAFSLVDVHLAGFVAYVGMCGFDTKSSPNIDAWLKRTTSRPKFGVAMAE